MKKLNLNVGLYSVENITRTKTFKNFAYIYAVHTWVSQDFFQGYCIETICFSYDVATHQRSLSQLARTETCEVYHVGNILMFIMSPGMVGDINCFYMF